jgi:hypothetical protein
MRMLLPCLLSAALALTACADQGAAPNAAGQGPDTAVARFVGHDEVTVVQVTVSDYRPMRSAELLGPGGVVIRAYSIDTNRAVAAEQPLFRPPLGAGGGFVAGFGGGGGSFSTGLGIALPLGGNYAAPGSQVAVSGQVQSTALIRLDDPQDYRRTWRDWKLRVQLGDPPNAGFVFLPAPQPPA